MSATNDEAVDTEEKSIDRAVRECGYHVRTHQLMTLIEGVAVLSVAVLAAFFVRSFGEFEAKRADSTLALLQEAVAGTARAMSDLQFRINESEDEQARLTEVLGRAKTANKSDTQERLSVVRRVLQAQQEDLKSIREQHVKYEGQLKAHQVHPFVTEKLLIAAAALTVMLVALYIAMYRFHLREITKNEQYKIGFMRIRIAASNADRPGFQSEVRRSLTDRAFDFYGDQQGIARKGKVESPLPGYPVSDLAAGIVNRLLDQVDIVLQPKSKS